jgi:predicted DNA-binding transcriptional regulator YafY
MNRFDRILGIVLQLRGGTAVAASQLTTQFNVSRRTIYRDIETLSLLGVPVYSEQGRGGGFKLLEGYFLPPLMFSTKEAVSLLLGLTFLHRLAHKPFASELAIAEQKLLAALPERLQQLLQNVRQIINFEEISNDIFHTEPDDALDGDMPSGEGKNGRSPNPILTHFLQAILDNKRVKLRYQSPYSQQVRALEAVPLGMFWDRNRWYLVGEQVNREDAVRLWRADRVVQIQLGRDVRGERPLFDIQALLNHNWLGTAMHRWREESPVKIQLTLAQAERLQQDWYYRHAHFEAGADGHIIMTFGEDNREVVLALLRWLGPGAVLLEPKEWQQHLRHELQQMLAAHVNRD